MELVAIPLVLLALGFGFLLILGGGLFFLLKWGAIGHYALKKEEPPQPGDYGLDQSSVPIADPGHGELDQTSGVNNG